ncbi:MAG: porin family protein [Tannerellaceae bacterium]|jgi:predicted porin|nr:porin family protein [Tannerellaceae bacterium]
MRNILIILIALVVGGQVSLAQKGEKRVGLATGFSRELGTGSPHFNISLAYNLTDRLGVVPSFDYYFHHFSQSKFGTWDVNADIRYHILTEGLFKVYPFAGLTVKHSDGHSGLGANLGIGADYEVTPGIDLFFNTKYQSTKDIDDTLMSIGANYKF